jgi:two-component system LytT family response regulator
MVALRILIVDDEPAIRGGIRRMLASVPDAEVAGECSTAGEALEAIQRGDANLVLLDIHLPDASGLEVVRTVGPRDMPPTVFVTAYDEHAIEAFELNALDYLLKPLDEERLERALIRAREKLAWKQPSQLHQLEALLASYRAAEPQRFVVRKANHYEFVASESIDWVESADNYVELHCGGKTHLLNETMGRMEELLDAKKFLRVHRRYIVNLDRIQAIHPVASGSYEIEMQHGARLTSGRNYAAAIRQLLGR